MPKAQSERNAEIYRKHEHGESNRSIAKHYNISEQRVSQIVCRMESQSDLPLTPLELSLHNELHRLNEIERQTVERLHRIVTLRLKTHKRLDDLMVARSKEHKRRSGD